MSSLAVIPQCMAQAPRSKRRKYSFTPAMDEAIRGAYQLFLDYGNRNAIGECATRLQLPKWMVTRRAGALGLARIKEPVWCEEEVVVLQRWGHLTDAVVQRKLKGAGFHRSLNGIHLKMRRLKSSRILTGTPPLLLAPHSASMVTRSRIGFTATC